MLICQLTVADVFFVAWDRGGRFLRVRLDAAQVVSSSASLFMIAVLVARACSFFLTHSDGQLNSAPVLQCEGITDGRYVGMNK